jgi:hypothetical protein
MIVGVITRRGVETPCPNCGGTHRIVETLRWSPEDGLPWEKVVERPCCRCRAKETT